MGLRYASSPRLGSSKTISQFQGKHLVWIVKGYLTLGRESKDTASFALKFRLEIRAIVRTHAIQRTPLPWSIPATFLYVAVATDLLQISFTFQVIALEGDGSSNMIFVERKSAKRDR